MRGKRSFRVYQSRKDASGLLIMSAGGFTRDSEKLYEDRIHLQAEINQLKGSNKRLQTQLARRQSNSPLSQEPYEALIRDLQQSVGKRDLEIVQLKREVQYYKLTDYEDRVKALLDDLNSWKLKAQSQSEAADISSKRLFALERSLTEKERRIEALVKENVSLSDGLKDANARRAAVEEELRSRSDLKKIPALKTELMKVRSANETLEADKRRLLTALNSKNKELEDLLKEIEAGKLRIEQLESEITRVNKALEDCESTIESAKAAISSERFRAEEAERQILNSNNEKEQLRRQAKNLGTSLSAKTGELADLQVLHKETVEKLEKQVKTIREEAESEINALKTENKILQSTVTEQGKRLQASDEVEYALRERIKELQEEQKALITDLEACKREISGLNERLRQCEMGKEAVIAELEARKSAAFQAISMLFEKLPKKLRKKEKSPSDLLSQFSDTASLTRKDLKRAFKSINFKPKKDVLKAAFLLLSDSEGKMPYSVLQQLCNQPPKFPDDLS